VNSRECVGHGCVLLLSGGIDSMVTGIWLERANRKIFPLFVLYGQPAGASEHESVLKISADRGWVKPMVVKLDYPGFQDLPCEGQKLGTETFQEEIPGRNLLFLSLAFAYASSIRATAVAMGIIDSDNAYYPDCSTTFLFKTQEQYKILDSSVELITPLAHFNKTQVVALARELGANLAATYSCNAQPTNPCGECVSCKERIASVTAVFP
jgi:7-cyano-7-deazaguanine synthase